MTEDEAKTKWCPMARPEESRGWAAGVNRQDSCNGWPRGALCIGSDCALWVEDQKAPMPVTGHCGLINRG